MSALIHDTTSFIIGTYIFLQALLQILEKMMITFTSVRLIPISRSVNLYFFCPKMALSLALYFLTI